MAALVQYFLFSSPSLAATISISGTSDATAGNTICVAVNSSPAAQTTSVGSSWTISNVTANTGDVITVWIDTATTAEQSTAVTKYNGTNITGMVLNRHVLTIGSNQNQNISVANLGLYDRDNNTNIMHTANASAFNIDGAGYPAGTYADDSLSILASNTLTIAGSQTLNARGLTINTSGILAANSTGGNATFNIYGNWLNSGTFTRSTSTVDFKLDSGTQTLNSGGTGTGKPFTNLTHSGAGLLQLITNNVSIAGTFTNSVGAGNFDANARATTVTGLSTLSDGSYLAKTATQTFNGGLTINGGTFTGSSGAVTISANSSTSMTLSSGTLTAPSGRFYIRGNWIKTGGTFDPGTYIVRFTATSGTQTLNSGGSDFYRIIHSGAGTVQLASNNLVTTGAFTNSAGTFDANGLTNTVTGLTTVSGGTYSASTGTQTFNGGLRISGGTFTGSSGSVNVSSSTSTSVTLSSGTLTAPSGAFNIYGNWTKSGGTFDPGTYTVTFAAASGTQTLNSGGANFCNISHDGAGTLRLTSNNLAATGTFTNSAGTFNAYGLTNTVTGLTTVSGGTYSPSTGTQTFNGGLTISGGTFTGSSGTVNATDVIISSGALTATTTALNISGNFTNNGTFTAGTSNVTFSGGGTSTVTGSAAAPNFAITFSNLTVSAGKTVKFGNGKYFKISNALALNGTSENHVTVTSDNSLTKWYLNHQGTETVAYVDIEHSGCDYTNSPSTSDVTMTGTNSTNNGDVEGCWVFSSAPDSPSSLTQKTSPSNVSIPESAAEADSTPDLGFTISDPDSGDTVKYEVQVAGNSAFASPIIDYTHGSLSANGSTFTFTIGNYGGGTCTGSCPSTLSDTTAYWWRVRAMDNNGEMSGWVEFGVAGTMDLYMDSTALIGGTLDMTAMTVDNFGIITLTALATNDSATMAPFTVTDARGTGAGWNVTVQATQFQEYSGGYVPGGKTLALSSLSMAQPAVAANGTSSPAPTITSGPYIIDSGSAVKIASAAINEGMGAYDFTPGANGLTLSIPADTYAAAYRSEVTVSIISGP